MKPILKYGWKRQFPDHRDYHYSETIESKNLILPSLVDHRPICPPIRDQGSLGACTAFGVTKQVMFLEMMEISKTIPIGPEFFEKGFVQLAELYPYFNGRYIDGDTNLDAGSTVRSVIMGIRRWGVCRETLWPYIEQKVCEHPSQSAYTEGLKHQIPTGYLLNNQNLLELKQCLANGFPFTFGMVVCDSFMSSEVAHNGIIPIPTRMDKPVGGHCMTAVGYDDAISMFIVGNSWGTQWGMQGYCYIPYAMLSNPHMAGDFWTLRNKGI